MSTCCCCRSANALKPGRAEASGVMMTFNEGPWQDHLGHLLHMPGHIHIRCAIWTPGRPARCGQEDLVISNDRTN